MGGPVFQKLPAFLADTKYTSPADIKNGPFQYGQGTKLDAWEWKLQHPKVEQAFHNYMAGYHQGRPSWMDDGFYPVHHRLVKGIKTGAKEVAIVDIGGNLGHDLEELKSKRPNLPGRFVLQDKADVTAKFTDSGKGIEAMSHDFFTEQPIKGQYSLIMTP